MRKEKIALSCVGGSVLIIKKLHLHVIFLWPPCTQTLRALLSGWYLRDPDCRKRVRTQPHECITSPGARQDAL